jgi:hypothetical protein
LAADKIKQSIHRGIPDRGDNIAAMTLLSVDLAGHVFIVWILGRDSGLHIYFTLAGGNSVHVWRRTMAPLSGVVRTVVRGSHLGNAIRTASRARFGLGL